MSETGLIFDILKLNVIYKLLFDIKIAQHRWY